MADMLKEHLTSFTSGAEQFTNAISTYSGCVIRAYDARVEKETAARSLAQYEATEVVNGRAGVGGNADERKRDLIHWRSEDLEFLDLERAVETTERAAMEADLNVEIARFDISLAKRRMEFAIALLRNAAEDRV